MEASSSLCSRNESSSEPSGPSASPPDPMPAQLVDVVRQTWVSEVQFAKGLSCGEEIITQQCYCVTSADADGPTAGNIPMPDGCMDVFECRAIAEHGWHCDANQDPRTPGAISIEES